MRTITEIINPDNPYENLAALQKGADIIKAGGLVAFPTETVYGLGGDALNPLAAKRIFEAKGRPSDNPLIVHIVQRKELPDLAAKIPPKAVRLMDRFWPGPLTLIFEKTGQVPLEITGGRNTVAVRMPSNPIARALIELSATPIAAPSANTSTRPSPSRASHVAYDLSGKIEMILDGGACQYGLESTVVDIRGAVPVLLRPGSVTLDMLRDWVGDVEIGFSSREVGEKETPLAPGMKYKHYSPTARVIVVQGELGAVVNKIKALAPLEKGKTAVLATEQTKNLYPGLEVLVLGDRDNPGTIAQNLFKMLRKCDYLQYDAVFAEGMSGDDLGMAIMNRLNKAAGYNIIEA